MLFFIVVKLLILTCVGSFFFKTVWRVEEIISFLVVFEQVAQFLFNLTGGIWDDFLNDIEFISVII